MGVRRELHLLTSYFDRSAPRAGGLLREHGAVGPRGTSPPAAASGRDPRAASLLPLTGCRGPFSLTCDFEAVDLLVQVIVGG